MQSDLLLLRAMLARIAIVVCGLAGSMGCADPGAVNDVAPDPSPSVDGTSDGASQAGAPAPGIDVGIDVGTDVGIDVGGEAASVGEVDLAETGEVGRLFWSPPTIGGSCCSDGACICRDQVPSVLTFTDGPYRVDTFDISEGVVYYPVDAEPPFSAVAVCGGFTNTGIEMLSWGDYFASWGIVTVVTWTGPLDTPTIRAFALLGAIDGVSAENDNALSPLYQQLAGYYGTSGYSMGGGGTTIASGSDPTLRSSVGFAAWAPDGLGVTVPTLLLCGSIDAIAPCGLNSRIAYDTMPITTPKMMVTVSGSGHLAWFGPDSVSGPAALAFQKVYLDGDERWEPLLQQVGGTSLFGSGDVTTNIW